MTVKQSVQTAGKAVAAKSRKPRVWVDLATAVSLFLTIVASFSYQLGAAGEIIPPSWKGPLAITGVVSTALLQAIRPFLPSPHAPAPQP